MFGTVFTVFIAPWNVAKYFPFRNYRHGDQIINSKAIPV